MWRKEEEGRGEGRGPARVWEAGLGRGLAQAGRERGGAGAWLGSGCAVLSLRQQEDREGVSGESDVRSCRSKVTPDTVGDESEKARMKGSRREGPSWRSPGDTQQAAGVAWQ